jgi:hypothetical protein
LDPKDKLKDIRGPMRSYYTFCPFWKAIARGRHSSLIQLMREITGGASIATAAANLTGYGRG